MQDAGVCMINLKHKIIILFMSLFVPVMLIGATADTFDTENQKWREERLTSLKSEEGWLTLAGLYWLKPGENKFGSASDNAIVFPKKAPAHAGTFTLNGKTVTLNVAPDVTVTAEGKPVKVMVVT